MTSFYLNDGLTVTPEIAAAYVAAEDGYRQALTEAARAACGTLAVWKVALSASSGGLSPEPGQTYVAPALVGAFEASWGELRQAMLRAEGSLAVLNRIVRKYVSDKDAKPGERVVGDPSASDVLVAWKSICGGLVFAMDKTALQDGVVVHVVDWEEALQEIGKTQATWHEHFFAEGSTWSRWESTDKDASLIESVANHLEKWLADPDLSLGQAAKVLSDFARQVLAESAQQ